MAISFDSNILLAYMQARTGQLDSSSATLAGLSGGGGVSTATQRNPTAPWSASSTAAKPSELVRAALSGKKLINENAAKLDVAGASTDYQKLFTLYQGLSALQGLAEQADKGAVGGTENKLANKAFVKGLAEVTAYADSLKLDNLRLTNGISMEMLRTQLGSLTSFGKADTDVGVPIDNLVYKTGIVHTGKRDDPVAGFQGAVQFDVIVKKKNSTVVAKIDLSDMGTTPRTMGNVSNFINAQLKAVGSVTRFSAEMIPGAPKTIASGGKTITVGAEPDKWSFKIQGDMVEQVSFGATAKAGAVYLTQTAGIADNPATKDVDEKSFEQQFVKLQNDLTVGGTPPVPTPQLGETFRIDGRVFNKTLDADIKSVRQTVTGADGSVYMLADITGTVDGQTIKGEQDVALLKYDSAGNLIYTRSLGAADKASGMALAVSGDGKVAVAGSTTGVFQEGLAGVDPTKSDSFVTLYDAKGDELWTQQRAAREDDEATAVSFADDGTVLVAGRSRSNMPGAASVGGWDGYLQSFTGVKKPLGGYKVVTNATAQFGTAGTDTVSAMAVSGNIMATVGIENGRAVVRRFDITDPKAPTLVASRDLGELQGTIAGIGFNGGEIVVAGGTRNPGLSAATVNSSHSGGTDAFVATLSSTFASGAGSDTLTYYGGAGNDAATAMTISDGKVWIAGSATKDLPGTLSAPIGKTDGYMVRMDASTGAVEWGRRFTAKDGSAAPTSIAVDSQGASALDALGLPKGPMEYTQSALLTSSSSVRAGDQFQIRTSEGGRAGTVTIEANETLQSLADKIKRAGGFQVKVQIVKDGNFQRLQIKPLNVAGTVEILPGKTDRNALEALGLPEGVVRVKPDDVKAVDKNKVYGLSLHRDLDLSTKDNIKAAIEQLGMAVSSVRTAYRDLNTLFAPKSAATASSANPTGEVPAYLKAQAANYQAALDRLLGGG